MEDNIDNYLGKHFAGESNFDEEKIVEDWAKQNHQEYLKLKYLIEASSKTDLNTKTYDYNKAWKKVKPQLTNYQDSTTYRMSSRILNNWISAAASILIIGFAFVYWYGFSSVSIETSKGEIKELVLNDGSKVILGEESTVVYQRNFKNFRNIKLKGRAYFDVVRDQEHIFTIDADDFIVQVLGTSFQITNTKNLKEITVSTGKVSVRNQSQNVLLYANDRAILSNSTIRKEMVNGSNTNAWVKRQLKFENATLKEVFNELENYYQVSFKINSIENLSCVVTSIYADESLESVLKELKTIFNFNYHIAGDTVIIDHIKCN